ncbi:hypothetical protein MCETHM1_00602 [Flavobacteriaceae bacterium]
MQILPMKYTFILFLYVIYYFIIVKYHLKLYQVKASELLFLLL